MGIDYDLWLDLCFTNRITICDLDDFLIGKAKEIWGTANSVWTIEIDNYEIDDLLTEAQEKLNSGELEYNETSFYGVINELLSYDVSIAMWYDLNCHNLKRCINVEQVHEISNNGITNPLGMCEVYFVMER